jgi:acyl carrier protein
VLDALAQQRRADGLAGTSISWSGWAGEGMAKDAGRGVGALDPELALSILSRVVVAAEPTVVVVDLQPQLLAALFSLRPSPLLGDLPGARRIAQTAAAERQQIESAGSAIRERLLALPDAKGIGFMVELVRTQAAGVLGHSSASVVGADMAFRELGVDSLTAIEIRNQLAGATGLSLPPSLVFDYPTPRVLARYLLEQILPESGSGTAISDQETEIRAALGSLSLAKLREAGVLETLLQMTRESSSDTATSGGDSDESIDTMDLDDLIEAAFKDQSDSFPDERSLA